MKIIITENVVLPTGFSDETAKEIFNWARKRIDEAEKIYNDVFPKCKKDGCNNTSSCLGYCEEHQEDD